MAYFRCLSDFCSSVYVNGLRHVILTVSVKNSLLQGNKTNKYFEKFTSDSAIRSVEGAYRYCSLLYDMPIKNIGPGHIKDVMSNGTWVVPEGKYKGEVRKASKCTQERIKSMCNLMFDYAFERMLISFNPARAFKITPLTRGLSHH